MHPRFIPNETVITRPSTGETEYLVALPGREPFERLHYFVPPRLAE